MSAFADPAFEGGDLIGREGFAFWWHDKVFVRAGNASEQGAFFGSAGGDGRAVRFAAVEGCGERVELEIAFGFAALMAGEAVRFEDRQNIPVEVHAVFLHCGDLS